MSYLTLYRPVGTEELVLIDQLRWEGFPPRLPEQPIFYPVLNEGYARQIALEWNSRRETDQRGYVTRWKVFADYAARFPRKVVGAPEHEELWVPAEELPVFNENISGTIELVAEYLAGAEVSVGQGGPTPNVIRSRRKRYPASALCGCYYCISTYFASEIAEWTDGDLTPVCPRCFVDAVLSSAEGYRVDDQTYLKRRHDAGFGP